MKKIITTLTLILAANLSVFAIEYTHSNTEYAFTADESEDSVIRFHELETQLQLLLQDIKSQGMGSSLDSIIKSRLEKILINWDKEDLYYIYEHFQRNPKTKTKYPACYKYLFATKESQAKHDAFLKDPYSALIAAKLTNNSDKAEFESYLKQLESSFQTLGVGTENAGYITLTFIEYAFKIFAYLKGANLNTVFYITLNYIQRTPGKKEAYPNLYSYLMTDSNIQELISSYKKDPYLFVDNAEELNQLFN